MSTNHLLEDLSTLEVRSVPGLAYDAIRSQIVTGGLAPGARVGQAELADRLGISRGSVREALRRLTGDGLVEFHVNRGFFVAEVGLAAVINRLEARLVFEPGVARLAAERRTAEDIAELRATIEQEERARDAGSAHDASRAFHRALAVAARNDAFVVVFDGLWIADVGRRLLAQRRTSPTWQADDAAEHRSLLDAVERRQGRRAHDLMRDHLARALAYWSDARSG
jgi:DNA-binding GntR family transcriptional regulator